MIRDDVLQSRALVALAEEMTRHGHDRGSPARSVMSMLGDRWTTLILLVLDDGELRQADLRRALMHLSFEKSIAQRVLKEKLRGLERDGFLVRIVVEDVPPKVSYRLTELGAALVERVRDMIEWINLRASQIRNARDRFDRECRASE